jgi:hypothetical protein
VSLNEVRGGIVLTDPEVPATVDMLQASATISAAGQSQMDLLAPSHPDYLEWVSVGKPACWAYPRQCHGDADGLAEGNASTGFSYVGPQDLNVLLAAWQVKEPPFGPGIASIENGICADFARDKEGDEATGYYRVGTTDLNVLVANWLVKEAPKGSGVRGDCGGNLVP